jgi:hypothetical protein
MTPSQRIPASAASSVIEDTLDGLDAETHAAFVMHAVEQLPLEEVAHHLGVTEREVAELVERAREFLRDRLQAAGCATSEAAVEELLTHARKAPSLSDREAEAALSEIFDNGGNATTPTLPATQVSMRDRLPKFERLLPAWYVGLGLGLGALLHAMLSSTRSPEPRSPPKPRVEVRTVVVHDAAPATAPPPVPASPNPGHEAPQTSGVRIVRVRCASPRAVATPAVVVVSSGDVQSPTVAETHALPSAADPDGGSPESIEVALIDEATTALAQGDAAGALGALSRHKERFPQGERSEQRDYLMAVALERLGDSEGAGRSAREFLRRYPMSIRSGRVHQIVERTRGSRPGAE